MTYSPIQKTKILSAQDTWLLSHASALLAYAESNQSFAESLAHHIQKKQWVGTTIPEPFHPSIFITPATQDEAIEDAVWLLEQLSVTTSARKPRSLLSIWAKGYESPKDFVFGVIGVAIIGPTLGLIDSKKRKRGLLKTVIEKHWYQQQSARELAVYIQRINQQVIAQELKLAGGNAYRLHPDSAAWCLEEPLIKIYLLDRAELDILNVACMSEHLSHHADVSHGAVRAISISPSVHDEFVSQFSTEEPK